MPSLSFQNLLQATLLLSVASSIRAADPLTIRGSATVAQAIASAVPVAKKQLGFEIKLSADGGSQGGFIAVATETAKLAMSTRRLEASDRAAFPEHSFVETQIGWQALAVGVARNVWDGGVKSLTKEQLVGIYERDTRNWQKVGGPDEPIKFFCPPVGKGIWELLAAWLYGEPRRAPLAKDFEIALTPKDARDAVDFNNSSFGLVPPQMTNNTSIFAVGLIDAEGTARLPTVENLREEKYPLARPLLLISNRKLLGSAKHFVDFLLSEPGQTLLDAAGFVPLQPIAAKAAPAP